MSTTTTARPVPVRARPDLWADHETLLRAPVAAAAVVAAAAHLPLTGEHLMEVPYIGALFVALEVVYLVLAASLCWQPTRVAYAATAAVSAAALLALLLSRTTGLPLLVGEIGDWSEPLAVLSLAAEAIALVGGVAALVGRPPRTGGERAASITVGVAFLVVGVVLVGLAGAAPTMDGMTAGLPPSGAAIERP